jgi:transposase InsO family protein
MSGKGNCYDNAMVETFFKTLKSELVWRTAFQTRSEAIDALACVFRRSRPGIPI